MGHDGADAIAGEDESGLWEVLHGERHMRKEPQRINWAKGTSA
jgi:hypothetical protein